MTDERVEALTSGILRHIAQTYGHRPDILFDTANEENIVALTGAVRSAIESLSITEGEVEQRAREMLAAECGGVVAHALETGNSRLVDVRAETALRAIVKALSVPSTVRSTPTPEGDRQ